MKALITGITGFAGSHLSEYLLSLDHEVHGLIRCRSRMEHIEHIKHKLKLHTGDLRDANSMQELINEVQPDLIFHLAAQSFVPMSWNAPAETLETNITGTVNLFEAVRKSKCNPKIQVAGSSEEYGMVFPDEVPIKETNPLRPLSPYGVSKVAQDKLCYQYNKSYNMGIIVTRAFNHTGPRRGEVFATSNFAKQIVEIEKGYREEVIDVGNLEAQRDFSDVRDIVRGYYLAATKGQPGDVYNISSGEAMTIGNMLNTLLDFSEIKNIVIKPDPKRMRPSDVPILLGDCTKFKKQTGWKPQVPFEDTMRELLEYWRMKI